MLVLNEGEKVKVRYEDTFSYVLYVEVTAISTPENFVGRVVTVLNNSSRISDGSAELCPGNTTFAELVGKEKSFKKSDIIL